MDAVRATGLSRFRDGGVISASSDRIDSIPEAGQGPGKGLLLEKQLKAYFL